MFESNFTDDSDKLSSSSSLWRRFDMNRVVRMRTSLCEVLSECATEDTDRV